jgi:hypothetical protein
MGSWYSYVDVGVAEMTRDDGKIIAMAIGAIIVIGGFAIFLAACAHLGWEMAR